MIRSRVDLPMRIWHAVSAGRNLQRANAFMRDAREARDGGAHRETVCVLVSYAREWHRSYVRELAKALAVQS